MALLAALFSVLNWAVIALMDLSPFAAPQWIVFMPMAAAAFAGARVGAVARQ